jgi:hypothetical protein
MKILIFIIKKWGVREWAGFIWLGVVNGGRLL